MALSRIAQQFADEIRQHDWSDAPYRVDRAGHRRSDDKQPTQQLEPAETDRVRTNVMWVTAQVLGYNDPNFDVYEFAEACGVKTTMRRTGNRNGGIAAGLRRFADGGYSKPGTWAER
ncbi:hypothetical protein AB0L22_09435 [Micromonospora haikouensis]|uniref:hypothetical protein n=1 Tax=Micromonospora haikouensis TaxID=686309 RepID=UPI0034343466